MEVFKIITKNWDDVLRSCAPSISLYLAGFANFQTFKFAKICLVGRYFCKSKNILQRDWIILSDISIYLSLKLEVKLYSTLSSLKASFSYWLHLYFLHACKQSKRDSVKLQIWRLKTSNFYLQHNSRSFECLNISQILNLNILEH